MHCKRCKNKISQYAKKCPYCLSEIALEATRCPHCTSVIELPEKEEKAAVAAAEAE